jgi:Orsellinic acid/F9775 biosynthesis cluster protein D
MEYNKELDVAKPEDTCIPSMEIEAIEGLKIVDGVKCDVCGAMFGTVLSMKKHCRNNHEWREWKGFSDIGFN